MLSRILGVRNHSARAFSTIGACYNKTNTSPKKFLSPNEFASQKQIDEIEEQAYKQNLLNEEYKYDPKYLSENELNPITKRPIPLNVELLKYKPVQLPPTHGHEVAKLEFKGYDKDSIIRSSEFAARAAFYLGIPCSKIHSLKTEKRLYTVIKSPFAQAKSKENFKRTTYGRKLYAYDATPEVVDLWLSFINKHAIEGVKYNALIHTRESLDFCEKLDALSAEDLHMPDAYKGSDDPIAKKVEELLKSDTFKKYFDGEAEVTESPKESK
ncbi:37S ribosomal protein S10, mitochondrial [Debaryomyces fabryi]|uniref:37S ribosomal protein S10, mitochondrial n=1 Tax=Debaryomyces fabryi TaxID=58627 RepID=A0A0V1PX51_9ASCO|nr:37S ribosomal protein S10, mitochondrial [Debaryomyces fabryi]KSA00843.1 37S ribosomal protein S10, mitochondrial [Debaryomyces fabryi]